MCILLDFVIIIIIIIITIIMEFLYTAM